MPSSPRCTADRRQTLDERLGLDRVALRTAGIAPGLPDHRNDAQSRRSDAGRSATAGPADETASSWNSGLGLEAVPALGQRDPRQRARSKKRVGRNQEVLSSRAGARDTEACRSRRASLWAAADPRARHTNTLLPRVCERITEGRRMRAASASYVPQAEAATPRFAWYASAFV
jgi:hypothetical protein